MTESEVAQVYMVKAEESLAGAESEFVNGRYNNTANRCYYACFQAATAALKETSVAHRGQLWGHEYVQAQFVGQLVNRQKVYPASLRQALAATQALRQKADYRVARVTRREASHSLEMRVCQSTWSRSSLWPGSSSS